jgi:hypothetical protein
VAETSALESKQYIFLDPSTIAGGFLLTVSRRKSNKKSQSLCFFIKDSIMQFQYNADYPGLGEFGQTAPPESIARDPSSFPPAEPRPCAKITARVYHPQRGQIATVQNVLVVSPGISTTSNSQTITPGVGGAGPSEAGLDDSSSSGMSSTSSSDDDSMGLDDSGGAGRPGVPSSSSSSGQQRQRQQLPLHAYWMQRTIREAIYGRVLFGVVLRRRRSELIDADGCEWEVTGDQCAVKEMSWQHIRRERERLAEDPIKEVACMQYIRTILQPSAVSTVPNPNDLGGTNNSEGENVADSFRAMSETNIMMPLDLLSDERNLYSIMPYADGGELFEVLDTKERFTEDE